MARLIMLVNRAFLFYFDLQLLNFLLYFKCNRMNDYNNYFEDYMKIINITTNTTTITAEICGQVTKIKFYEKLGGC